MANPELDVLQAGQQVGEYIVEAQLGSGAMGVVYRATHARMAGKRVALKLLKRGVASDPRAVKRFEREAAAVARIGHPGIIDIFDFGLLPDGTSFYAMELLEGQSLGQLLKRQHFISPDEALQVLRPVASALDAAHAKGVIHRDLKAENIYLARPDIGELQVKLLDFGLAKITEGAEAITREGTTLGTPLYIAPEQWKGGEIDHRADIYALGVLTYRMLTGKFPFLSTKLHELLNMHMNDPPVPPSVATGGRLPDVIDPPVLAALSKTPDKRPATAGDYVALLGEANQVARQLARIDKLGNLDPTKTWQDPSLVGLSPAEVIRVVEGARRASEPPPTARRESERAAPAVRDFSPPRAVEPLGPTERQSAVDSAGDRQGEALMAGPAQEISQRVERRDSGRDSDRRAFSDASLLVGARVDAALLVSEVGLASTDERLHAAGAEAVAEGADTASAGREATLAADPLSSTDREMMTRATGAGPTADQSGPRPAAHHSVPPEPPSAGPEPLHNRSMEATLPGSPPPPELAAVAGLSADGPFAPRVLGPGDTLVEDQPAINLTVLQPTPRWILWGWIGVGVLAVVLIGVLLALFRS